MHLKSLKTLLTRGGAREGKGRTDGRPGSKAYSAGMALDGSRNPSEATISRPPGYENEETAAQRLRKTLESSTRGKNEHSPKGSATCFRITGLPKLWDREGLERRLNLMDPHLKDFELSGPFPECFDQELGVALLTVNNLTNFLRGIKHGERLTLPKDGPRGSQKNGPFIDKDFYDLTPLNYPTSPIIADLVAITGLGGHAYGSWRSRAPKTDPVDRPMWLRDFLPDKFPNVRIMTYGYNSSLRSKSEGESNLSDYRRNFLECLRNARRQCTDRPIIFIGHSLGGLVVIQTLMESVLYPQFSDIHQSVSGVFLFGTPHAGLKVDDLWQMVNDEDQQGECILAQLREGSIFLDEQKDNISRVWESFQGKVVTFYETRKTRQIKKSGNDEFKRLGTRVQLVERVSSKLQLPGEHAYALNSDHTGMAKFDSSLDTAFQTVLRHMHEFLDAIVPSVDSAELVGLLLPFTRDAIWSHSIDQSMHLKELPKLEDPTHDERVFWLLRNLDFRSWYDGYQDPSLRKDSVERPTILIVRDPRNSALESVAAHIRRFPPSHSINPDSLVLFVFFRSLHARLPCDSTYNPQRNSRTLIIVCTLLRQICESSFQSQLNTEALLYEFMVVVVEHTRTVFTTLQKDSRTLLDDLFSHATAETLWIALRSTMIMLFKSSVESRNGENQAAQVTLIFDTHDEGTQEVEHLLQDARKMATEFGREKVLARVLVTSNCQSVDSFTRPRAAVPEASIVYDEERQSCLRSLQFYNTRYGKITSASQNTCQWLENTPAYQAWAAGDSSVLLIEGKPGSGKSTLARHFNDNILRKLRTKDTIVANFFFSYRDGEHERSHSSMYRSLLYAILIADETFFIHVQSTYRKLFPAWNVQHQPNSPGWSRHEMEEILVACTNHPLPRKLLFILDALDESTENERSEVLDFFWNLSARTKNPQSCPVRVFVATRPINELDAELRGQCHRIILEEQNQADLKEYALDRLDHRDFSGLKNIRQQCLDYVVQNADGVFLWARLVLDDLLRLARKGKCPATIYRHLKALPKQLEHFYVNMLEELEAQLDDEDLHDSLVMLQFCLYSHRAVTLDELENALAISAWVSDECSSSSEGTWLDKKPTDIDRRITDCLRNFVETKPKYKSNDAAVRIVQIMHQTIREFFLNPHSAVQESRLHSITNRDQADFMIETTCWNFLCICCQEINAQFGDASAPLDFVAFLDERPLIRYALEYLQHAVRHQDGKPPWMEALYDCDTTMHSNWLLRGLTGSDTNPDCSRTPSSDLRLQKWTDFIPNSMIEDGSANLLHLAARGGFNIAAGVILATGTDVESKIQADQTVLHVAAEMGHNATVLLLAVDGKADVEAKDKFKQTALHKACKNGHTETARLLVIDCHANVEAEDTEGFTALHAASSHGHEATVRMLVGKCNSDVTKRGNLSRLYTALHLAAGEGHQTIARFLVTEGQANVDTRCNKGRTALHWAAERGHDDVVHTLVMDCNAEIDTKDNQGQTPLHLAACNGHAATSRMLVFDCKANPEETDIYGSTALHLAAYNGYEATARVLAIEAGSKVDARDATQPWQAPQSRDRDWIEQIICQRLYWHEKSYFPNSDSDEDCFTEFTPYRGQTALHHAATNGHTATARMLAIEGYASVNSKDKSGETAIFRATKHGHSTVLRLLLKEANPDIEAKDNKGRTCLHAAAYLGRETIAHILLSEGKAHIAARDFEGRTPMHLAAYMGHESTARILLCEAAADIDAVDNEGRTPLHLVVRHAREHYGNYRLMIRLLIEGNADINATDNKGQTPLHICASLGREIATKILVEEGKATINITNLEGQTESEVAIANGHVTIARMLQAYPLP